MMPYYDTLSDRTLNAMLARPGWHTSKRIGDIMGLEPSTAKRQSRERNNLAVTLRRMFRGELLERRTIEPDETGAYYEYRVAPDYMQKLEASLALRTVNAIAANFSRHCQRDRVDELLDGVGA